MANKNLYVTDNGELVWDKLEKLSKGSVSQVVNRLVREEVKKLEAMAVNREGIERIVIEVSTSNDSGMYTGTRNIAFDGKWLVEGEQGFSVAQTRKGNLLVYYTTGEYGGNYYPFNSFEEIDSYDPEIEDVGLPEIPGEVKDAVAEALGMEYEEFLDI